MVAAAALPLVLGAAGAGVSAIGAIGQGASNAAEARYQAEVSRSNAITAGQNANYVLAAGNTQATDVGLQERAKQGAITTGIAANNLDVNTGSAAQVRESAAELGSEDVSRTLANANLTAYGYRTQATSFTAESQLQTAEAPRDILGGLTTGLGTLATGASNLGYKWFNLNNPAAATGT